ncbi:GntR family transcriptional regulator [Bhargavaea ullalensis]|uniref:GntR family transcriptional regulator n=1 Tax=Bhargavaea ullalensis TaxID=1265685 RepID=A0ABV2GFG8_9BACL
MTIKADHRHLYLQVIDRLKRDITTGVFKEKEKLPSEFELAKMLGVSRATLREALRLLEEDHYIVRRHGVGTFVNPRPLFSAGIEELSSVSAMIRQVGMEPGTNFLSSSEDKAAEEDMERFGCGPDELITTIRRVRTADGDPVVYCIDKVPSRLLGDEFLKRKDDSIFEAIEREADIRITQAVAHIEPVGYDEAASPILECEPETALLMLRQYHYAEGDDMVLYSRNYFKGDKFNFHVLRKRM